MSLNLNNITKLPEELFLQINKIIICIILILKNILAIMKIILEIL